MPPTPPSTTSSSFGGQSPEAQYRVVRKRNRVPLSCAPCRHRKLKCNRSHPCENCIKRGDASSCSYAALGTRKNQSQGATSPDDMQNRIDRLEGLVLSLMTNGAQSAGPVAAINAISRSQSDNSASSLPMDAEHEDEDEDDDDMIKEEDDESEVEGVTNSLGVLKVDADQGKTLYVGNSHWHLVLADIAEVKNYFVLHKKELERTYEKIRLSKPQNTAGGPAFLFSSHETATDLELRSELPAKSAVDKLITRYFNSYDPAIYIIHAPTFRRDLQKHWQDPSKTSIVWLGLLYSLMCLAMQSYHKIGDEPLEWKGQTQDLAAQYRIRTVQCLVNSDYTKTSNYTIETLIMYVNGEYAIRWDAEVGIWLVVGMIVRLAMRMGYHRDPSNYGIGPYEGEIRRRIWATVRGMDIMFSCQLALPGMIRCGDCDTALPRNIFEDEFGPDSKTLPPSRPSSEPTPVSYMITQTQLTYEFGEILAEINAVSGKPVSYEDILKRDTRLRKLKDDLAPHLRIRPMEECTHDPATLLMQRFNIDIMWQKTVCVLHRKYLGRARQNPRYAPSRRACIDASMEILRHQAKLHQESQPGGRMRTMKWFISSLTKHDYLLAAMLLCLDLNYDSKHEKRADFDRNVAQRAEMLQALENTLQLWKEGADVSMEAFKGSNVIEIMLQKIKCASSAGPTTAEVFAQFDDQNIKPEHSAAMTLGMLSGGLTPNTAAFLNSGVGASPMPLGVRYGNMDVNMGGDMSSGSGGTGLTPFAMEMANPFATMGNNLASPNSTFENMGGGGSGGAWFDAPMNLDWEAWDQYIQSGSTMDPSFQFYPSAIMDAAQSQSQSPSLGQDSPQQQQQQQQQLDSGKEQDRNQNQNQGYGNSVFMGANTPGR